MYDTKEICEKIDGIGGQQILATKIGKKKVLFHQTDGKIVERIMDPVKYCANAQERLLSIPNEMSHHGAKLISNDCCDITLTYPNGDRIVLDRHIKTKNGWVPGVDVISNIDEIANMANSRKTSTRNSKKSGQSKKIDINEFHRQLGHPSFDSTQATEKAQNITLTGT